MFEIMLHLSEQQEFDNVGKRLVVAREEVARRMFEGRTDALTLPNLRPGWSITLRDHCGYIVAAKR